MSSTNRLSMFKTPQSPLTNKDKLSSKVQPKMELKPQIITIKKPLVYNVPPKNSPNLTRQSVAIKTPLPSHQLVNTKRVRTTESVAPNRQTSKSIPLITFETRKSIDFAKPEPVSFKSRSSMKPPMQQSNNNRISSNPFSIVVYSALIGLSTDYWRIVAEGETDHGQQIGERIDGIAAAGILHLDCIDCCCCLIGYLTLSLSPRISSPNRRRPSATALPTSTRWSPNSTWVSIECRCESAVEWRSMIQVLLGEISSLVPAQGLAVPWSVLIGWRC